MPDSLLPSSGVQELVQRLREEGLAAGRREGEQVLAAARAEAERILADARRQAEEITKAAHDAVETERQAARAALDLAWRDAMLQLREQLEGVFVRRLQSLVASALQDQVVLAELVVGALRSALPPGRTPDRAELFVPESYAKDPAAAQELETLVATLSRDLLEGGVDLVLESPGSTGVRIRLAGRGIELAVTDETLAALLLERLLPRFRALFEVRVVRERDRG